MLQSSYKPLYQQFTILILLRISVKMTLYLCQFYGES
nr:MAG TPA: hypothetical protein [Crassvirales sp.]